MNNPALFTSNTPEWYTPPDIITAVISVMGCIDLDPCSPFSDGPVPAKKHYTIDDDGLVLPWCGRVYMNPPYGRIWQKWARKAIKEYRIGNATEIILLIAARPDTRAWQELSVFPWCGITGRLHFSGHPRAAPFPSAVFYLGDNIERFKNVFGPFGPIYRAVSS